MESTRLEATAKFMSYEDEVDRRSIAFGAQQAIGFVRKVAMGEKVGRRRYSFNWEFIREVHRRVEYGSKLAGQFRLKEGMGLGYEPIAHVSELPMRTYLFGRWLETQVDRLQHTTEDVVASLEVAAAAHYGLTHPELHPFYNGNGRVARALVNAIIMKTTYELRVHRFAILPIPILRAPFTESERYIDALQNVGKTKTLNPLMMHLAQRWEQSLSERMDKIKALDRSSRTKADEDLIGHLNARLEGLREFIASGGMHGEVGDQQQYKKTKGYIIYPVPDYFNPDFLRRSSSYSP